MSGIKRLNITYEQVVALREDRARYTWEDIAAILECSRATVIRAWNAGRQREEMVKRRRQKDKVA